MFQKSKTVAILCCSPPTFPPPSHIHECTRALSLPPPPPLQLEKKMPCLLKYVYCGFACYSQPTNLKAVANKNKRGIEEGSLLPYPPHPTQPSLWQLYNRECFSWLLLEKPELEMLMRQNPNINVCCFYLARRCH